MLVEGASAAMFGRLMVLFSSDAASVASSNGVEVVIVITGTFGRRILGSGITPEATRGTKLSPTPAMWGICLPIPFRRACLYDSPKLPFVGC